MLDAGFVGSILGGWIKHAPVGKYSMSNRILSRGRSTVARSVSINTRYAQVVWCIRNIKKILPLLRRARSRGILDLKEPKLRGIREFWGLISLLRLNLHLKERSGAKIRSGREMRLGMVLSTVGSIGHWGKQRCVHLIQHIRDVLNGRIKAEIIKEKLETGSNYVRSVILNTINPFGGMQQNYGN
jgi:hypothetical protein